jgi:hypothetical protein
MIGVPKGYVGIFKMFMRLRALPWGWMTIGLAYGVAVLPILVPHRMAWVAVATALAYLVLARRTTIQTAQMAQAHDDMSVFRLWRTAFRTTWLNMGLLALPMICLTLAAKDFLVLTPSYCSGLFHAYCMVNNMTVPVEQYLLCGALLVTFLALDHGLLVALALMTHKHLPKSSIFVGNTAVGLRFALACTVMSVVAVSINMLDLSMYWPNGSNTSVTDRRVLETVYPGFEPLVTNGVLLGANILNRPPYCVRYADETYTSCQTLSDTRPFIARQLVSGMLGMLMYGLLLLGVLRLTAPFSLTVRINQKAKRSVASADTEIAYL